MNVIYSILHSNHKYNKNNDNNHEDKSDDLEMIKLKPGIPSDEELIKLFNTGKGNIDYMVDNDCVIDTVSHYHGLPVERYRRTCLKCGKTMIGHGRYNRLCSNCIFLHKKKYE